MYISSDTNIWFDFSAVGHLDYPFRLPHAYCISQNAFQDEILEADLQDQLVAKGLQLTQMTNEEYQQAIDYANAYPKLSTWRVPKGWGRILGGTLAALYVLSRLLPNTVSTMFYVFSGIFDQVFALQGIAAICYLLHSKGKKGFLKGLVFVLGYTLLRSPAVMVGIFDQIVDFTHRRENLEKDENPFDPRGNNLI